MSSPFVIGLGLAGGSAFILGAALGEVPIPSAGTAHSISEAVTAAVLLWLAREQAKKRSETTETPKAQETPSNPSLTTFPPRSENSERLVELVGDVKGLVESFQEHRGEFREHRADTKARLRTVEGRLGINNPQIGELPRPGARS